MKIKIDTSIKMPLKPLPIYLVGAGAIVKEAHLPGYQKAGWEVRGICDLNVEKAESLATQFKIRKVFCSLEEMAGEGGKDALYDVAIPAASLQKVLPVLPDGAKVMIQKPLGENIEQAYALYNISKKKALIAGVNFQKKFIPAVIAARRIIEQGLIGDLHDMEIRMNIHHPWELWDFLFGLPRMEMLYHSIHYMDLIKYFFGSPDKVHAKTFQHPKQMQLSSTRSIIIFDYNKPVRAFVNTNHGHDFGLKYQDSFIKWEGTNGAIRAQLGKNINFPEGIEDKFEYIIHTSDSPPEWQTEKLEGSWYPDAFIGSVADLMCFAEGSSKEFITSIDEAIKTMEIVEAAYASSEKGGTEVKYRFR